MAKATTNSHKITIYRSGSFLAVAQGKEVRDFFSASRQSIGAYFESNSSRRIASGLTPEEEELLVPEFVGYAVDHPEYRKKRDEFFSDIDTAVPYDGGRTLEIGLKNSNKDAMSKGNPPLEPMDYIRYRHALGHPKVAPTQEASVGNMMMSFYIFDKVEAGKRNSLKMSKQDDALNAYQEIKNDPNKVRQALVLLGTNPDVLDVVEHVGALRAHAEKTPDNFLSVMKDKNFEITYWLKTMVDHKILKVMGKKYFDAETDRLIGNDLEEATYFFLDDLNSDLIGTLKARLQDKLLNTTQA